MASVTIRNLDDGVVERLKSKAKDNGRSLEAELREILSTEARRASTKELIAEADRIAAMTPKDRPQTDSVKIIREFRDSR